jgi:hypothetical protein
MNTTAERVRGYSRGTTIYASSGTAEVDDDYQEDLIAAVAANDYSMRSESPATAKGHLMRRDSTVFTSTANVPRPSVRVAEWDGYVTEVSELSFTAVLRGIAGEGVAGESHDAQIALDDVGQSDRTLLRPGAFFRICIYFQLDEDDRPKRYAKVVFRRLPAYRQAELEQADRRSDERHRKLRVE